MCSDFQDRVPMIPGKLEITKGLWLGKDQEFENKHQKPRVMIFF